MSRTCGRSRPATTSSTAARSAACAGEDWARPRCCVASSNRYGRWSAASWVARAAGVAQDVAQDALLGVLRGLPRYDLDHRASLSTWVLTIAARTAISELRRARGDAAPLSECDLVALERPDAALERERLGAAITEAVEHLSPRSAPRSCCERSTSCRAGDRRDPRARSRDREVPPVAGPRRAATSTVRGAP
ncbi:MAG: sigma-70 family RNA polymerase sigma factor [Nannocystaceae bacterium]